MTEKNIFTYKLFLSLNISDFNLFFYFKIAPSPPPPSLKKSLLSFPATPSKSWGPISPPFFWKFGWRFNLPSREGGVYTMFTYKHWNKGKYRIMLWNGSRKLFCFVMIIANESDMTLEAALELQLSRYFQSHVAFIANERYFHKDTFLTRFISIFCLYLYFKAFKYY